jgi:uncharacterized protein
MAGISVNRLTNANVYVNGNNLLGRVQEIELPVVKQKMAEHKALGMVGTVEFFSGLEKMESKLTWNSYYSDALLTAADPSKTVQLQVRASLETYDSTGRVAQVPAVVFLTAQYKDFPLGNFKQHDNVELVSMLSVTSFRMEIDGQAILEIDVLSNIYKVNGSDVLADYRSNIGG